MMRPQETIHISASTATSGAQARDCCSFGYRFLPQLEASRCKNSNIRSSNFNHRVKGGRRERDSYPSSEALVNMRSSMRRRLASLRHPALYSQASVFSSIHPLIRGCLSSDSRKIRCPATLPLKCSDHPAPFHTRSKNDRIRRTRDSRQMRPRISHCDAHPLRPA